MAVCLTIIVQLWLSFNYSIDIAIILVAILGGGALMGFTPVQKSFH
jgi:hypothetical protein